MRAGTARVAGQAFGPITPWRWLQQATGLLRTQPRVMLGATSLLLAVALAPSVVQLALWGASPQLAQWLSVLMSLLLYPPVVAGYYRVVHAAAQGAQPPPSAIFAVFSDAATVRRMIIANLILISGILLVFSLLFWAFGGEELLGFLQQLSQLQPGAKNLPTPPDAMLPLTVVLLLLGAALITAQGLAYAELALGSRPPLAAIGAALRLLGRHFWLLLLFYIPIAVLGFLVFMFVVLVAMLLGMALAVAYPPLAPLLMLVASLGLALVMYALVFTFFYFAWREWLGDATTPASPPPAPTHHIAA